jgi:hypothetical protein
VRRSGFEHRDELSDERSDENGGAVRDDAAAPRSQPRAFQGDQITSIALVRLNVELVQKLAAFRNHTW